MNDEEKPPEPPKVTSVLDLNKQALVNAFADNGVDEKPMTAEERRSWAETATACALARIANVLEHQTRARVIAPGIQ